MKEVNAIVRPYWEIVSTEIDLEDIHASNGILKYLLVWGVDSHSILWIHQLYNVIEAATSAASSFKKSFASHVLDAPHLHDKVLVELQSELVEMVSNMTLEEQTVLTLQICITWVNHCQFFVRVEPGQQTEGVDPETLNQRVEELYKTWLNKGIVCTYISVIDEEQSSKNQWKIDKQERYPNRAWEQQK